MTLQLVGPRFLGKMLWKSTAPGGGWFVSFTMRMHKDSPLPGVVLELQVRADPTPRGAPAPWAAQCVVIVGGLGQVFQLPAPGATAQDALTNLEGAYRNVNTLIGMLTAKADAGEVTNESETQQGGG